MTRSTIRTLVRMGAALALLFAPSPSQAQVTFEFYVGSAINVPTPLTITQSGFPDISETGHYAVKPFEDRMYYAARLGYWKDDTGWLFELLHHKLYLEDPPEDVESFEVTHGYNIFTINRGWRLGGFVVLAGGGPVIPHSNSIVRGRERSIDAPYTLAGVAAQGAVSRQFSLSSWLFATAEGKVTAAWAKVPVVDGDATVPNIAFHGLVGLGVRF